MMHEKCTLNQLQNCLEPIQSVNQHPDLLFVTTRQELQIVCRILKETVSCVDDHMKHCFSSTQRKFFNDVVEGARQFLKDLCIAGSIQETYLKHSTCYRNVSLSETKCAPKHRHLIQLSEKVEQRNADDGLRETCCAFDDLVHCKT
ncbi:hypothetical protein HNY73_000961 [Argiope bruennichi]|uniref:Uncharacterized protein n=1 Tax=Argiope bruennichi TaxID=94029 RepID=A0A8T0G274_ARGBR|nr:hypothetical protein HNY73_000961 [Argiope bruennichi]